MKAGVVAEDTGYAVVERTWVCVRQTDAARLLSS